MQRRGALQLCVRCCNASSYQIHEKVMQWRWFTQNCWSVSRRCSYYTTWHYVFFKYWCHHLIKGISDSNCILWLFQKYQQILKKNAWAKPSTNGWATKWSKPCCLFFCPRFLMFYPLPWVSGGGVGFEKLETLSIWRGVPNFHIS